MQERQLKNTHLGEESVIVLQNVAQMQNIWLSHTSSISHAIGKSNLSKSTDFNRAKCVQLASSKKPCRERY